MTRKRYRVGRVLRAGTRGFTVGCRVLRPGVPAFGAFVRADVQAGRTYGLIYDVSIEDDLFSRRFVGADPPEEVVRDQRENRLVPIEVSVLAVGGRREGQVYHGLPQQPPLTLDWLHQCTAEEVRAFTARLDYLRLVLDAHDVPSDELLVASIRAGAEARAAGEREAFLVEAGRELVRLLAGDLVRLESLLRRLR
jgi:hypothetical protein